MKKALWLFFTSFIFLHGFSQDIDFRDGIIFARGQAYARLTITPLNGGTAFGYHVSGLSGEKILTATPLGVLDSSNISNTRLLYQFTFIQAAKTGYFYIDKMGAIKSLGYLLTRSGIMEGSDNAQQLEEFIKSFGVTISNAPAYPLVSRNRSPEIRLHEDGTIDQQNITIGKFILTGSEDGKEYYDLTLPSGELIARFALSNNSNSKPVSLFTTRDNLRQSIDLPSRSKTSRLIRGQHPTDLERMICWLVEQRYL